MPVGGTPDSPCGGEGDIGKICDCMECANRAIVAALNRIADALGKKVEDECNLSQDCINKIYDKIKQKVEGPLKSCSECQTMLQHGLGGTLEYAVRCANVTCDQCDNQCFNEGPINEGKCCKTCGKTGCTCKGGVCTVPEDQPEPDKKSKKYIGWCRSSDGVVGVTKDGEEGLGPGWNKVTFADTEEVALQEAAEVCKKDAGPKFTPQIEPVINSGASCDLFSYVNGQAFQALQPNMVYANIASGNAQAMEAAGRLGLEGINVNNVLSIFTGYAQLTTGMDGIMLNDIAPMLAGAFGCNSPQFTESLKALGAIAQASNYLNLDVTPWLMPYIHTMNASCRQKFLSPDQAIASYLANSITPESLDAHWAINGLCSSSLNEYLAAARAKPVPLQLSMMRRRGIISDQQLADGYRQLGYLEPQVVSNLHQLTEQVPTMTDIARFMVRDAGDDQLVAKFGLDDQFEQKYTGKLRKWSEDQGLPEDFARYYWRSHWTIPAPGQLFNFYHRLRRNPNFEGEAKLLENINTALIQQDILPFWHKYFLATSFRPITRVDARRAFDMGALNKDALELAYTELGYSDDRAKTLTEFADRLRRDSIPNKRPVKLWHRWSIDRPEARKRLINAGLPEDAVDSALDDSELEFAKSNLASSFVRGDITYDYLRQTLATHGVSSNGIVKIVDQLRLKINHNPAVDDYAAGMIGRDDAIGKMNSDGISTEVATKMVDNADRDIKRAFAIACQRGIKRRYLLGELDATEAKNELVKNSTDLAYANRLVDNWGCERGSVGKAVPAAKLCGWLDQGVISPQDFTARLRKIGYSETDAALLLDDCATSNSAKRIKQAKLDANQEAAARRRTARILATQARQEQQAIADKERKQIAAAKARANREGMLVKVAMNLEASCQCGITDSLVEARTQHKRLQDQYAFTVDESLKLLTLASQDWEGGELSLFGQVVDSMAQAVVAADLTGQPDEVALSFSSNGTTMPSS